MVTIPWIDKIKKSKKEKSQRDINSTEENELLDLAKERFELSRSEKTDHNNRPLHDKWRELDKIYRSDQWKGTAPAYKSRPVLNFTFGLVESIVPRLTDSLPQVLIMARRDAQNEQLAKMLTDTQAYLWSVNKMQQKNTEAIRMCLKYGTVIYQALWDPDFYDNLGEVSYEIVHPMNFYNDPRAYTMQTQDFCFTTHPNMPIEHYMRRWPDKGPFVIDDNDTNDLEDIRSNNSTQEKTATLYTYYFRDEDGNLCAMRYAGNLVLDVIGGKYDGTNAPIAKHNKFPFAKCDDYPLDKEFWSMGEIEIIEMLQRLINNFEAQIIDNTRLMANAEWVVNKAQSGLREEDAWIFNSRPGKVIFTHNGGVNKEKGVPIPQHIPEHMERLIFAMEQILGVHDVVQGRRPVGVRAASAIIALQESANVRVRQKSKNLQYALEDLVELGNWLILENYNEPRKMRLTGKTVPTTLNIHDALKKRVVDMAAVAGFVEQGINPEELDEDTMAQIMQEVKYPEFDTEVKVGPSVPYSQALLYEQSKEFFQLGLIDRKAVLETTNFPNREEILARMEGAQIGEGHGQERMGERTFGDSQQG